MGEDNNGEVKIKRMTEVGAQALLLIDPGAELDWAELSDTLPSVLEKAENQISTIDFFKFKI